METGTRAGLPNHVHNSLLAAQAEGLAIKREPHTNRVPRSQRGGEVVEPLVRPCSECQGHEQPLVWPSRWKLDADAAVPYDVTAAAATSCCQPVTLGLQARRRVVLLVLNVLPQREPCGL